MKKTLTVNIPDELWVDEFTKGLTAQYNYDGPSKIWIKTIESSISPQWFDAEPELDPTEASFAIDIDISKCTTEELAVAIMLVHSADEHTYRYADEINHDGSIYKRITNPRLTDYYVGSYVSGQIGLKVVTKDKTVKTEEIALSRKNYILKYTKAYDFDTVDSTKIQEYLTKLDAYLETVKTAYPWKYISLDLNEVPKIPVSLVTLFNSLPELD